MHSFWKLYVEYDDNPPQLLIEFETNLKNDDERFTEYFLKSNEITIKEMNIQEESEFCTRIEKLLLFCSKNQLTYQISKNIKDLMAVYGNTTI